MKAYALCIMANHAALYLVNSFPKAVLAESQEEAVRMGVQLGQQAFPVNDGWTGHHCTAVEIPSYIMESYPPAGWSKS